MSEARSGRLFAAAGYTALLAHAVILAGTAFLAIAMLVSASGPEPGADMIMMGYFIPVSGLAYAAFACAIGGLVYVSERRRLGIGFFGVAAVGTAALVAACVAAPIVLSK